MGLTRPRAHQLQETSFKFACKVISTSNVTLSGGAPATVDGVSVAQGDRVLVIGQTDKSQNGIYNVTTVGTGSNGTWARSKDADDANDITAGTQVSVTEGTTYADSVWKLTTDGTITIGTTDQDWEQASAYGFGTVTVDGTSLVADQVGDTLTITAGNNISLSGNATSDTYSISVSDSPTFTGNLTAGNLIATTSVETLNFTVSDSLTIGSQIIYAQGTNGFSVNEDYDPSNSSTQTAYHFTSGAGRETVAFTLARTSQFTDGFGIYGTSSDNKFVMFGEQSNTSWEWRKGVGIQPLDLDGGTLVANLSAAGNFATIGTITGTGNVAGGNLTTAGQVSATGNVTGGNLVTAGVADVTGNVTGGNLVTAGVADVTGNITGGNLTTAGSLSTGLVLGNLTPSANVTYYLGNATNQWHSVFVGPGSLYINGQKVLQEDSGTIVVGADENQNISLTTTGTGDIEFNPGGSIELKGNVVLAAGKTMSQAGGAASEFSAGVKSDSVTSRTSDTNLTLSANGTGVVNVNDSMTVANDLTVTGNLTINGATTTVSSTNTTIEDALIVLVDGQSGAPTKDAGLVIDRGSSTNVAWMWDESADQFVAVTTSEDGTTAGDVTITDYTDIRVGSATIDDTLTATGNVTGGNLITGAQVVATGNVTGGNLITGAQVVATGNITGGNLITAGLVSATGNVTGGNLISSGAIHTGNNGVVRFYDSDGSNYVEFRSQSTVASNLQFKWPSSDGTSGQVLQTDGAGTLSFATASGGGGGASGFQSSTITTHPAAAGDEDLATGPSDDTAETPFESGAQDAFGVSLGTVYDQMEPIGSTTTIDLGDSEAYVGA